MEQLTEFDLDNLKTLRNRILDFIDAYNDYIQYSPDLALPELIKDVERMLSVTEKIIADNEKK